MTFSDISFSCITWPSLVWVEIFAAQTHFHLCTWNGKEPARGKEPGKNTMYDDPFCQYYSEFLDGTYDCVDRLVLNAYIPLLQSGGGFRQWWRLLNGNDDHLDNAHLMRFAGHFSRRVRAYATKNKIHIQDFDSREEKEDTVTAHMPGDAAFRGLFCILVNRAPAPVMEVKRSNGHITEIGKKKHWPHVNIYSFHIIDAVWGHIIIRFCPHPPFNAMIILNGHEYVERQARQRKIPFTKEDNCFAAVPNAPALATIADSMRASSSVGRLADVCERWIYSCCLCFALERAEQEKTGIRYSYSVFQAELSRNLLFTRGKVLDHVFNGVIERTRVALDIRSLKTIFGHKHRPYNRDRHGKLPRVEIVVEKPVYDLTVFKIHFGRLTVKMYSKGARVLRIEVIVHNTAEFRCKRSLENFPEIIDRLAAILDEFMSKLQCVDVACLDAQTVQTWRQPGIVGACKTAGIDINDTRQRAVMESLVMLSIAPGGVATSMLAEKVREILGVDEKSYSTRQAAYDLKKFRGKAIVVKIGGRRYQVTTDGVRSMAGYLTLLDKVILPVLAGKNRRPDKQPISEIDRHIVNIQEEIKEIFREYRIAA
jgi:hypothetical protein